MKKIITLVIALALALTLCACGEKPVQEEGESAQMINPMVEVSREELKNGIGVYPPVPPEADDLTHFIISGNLGEVQFSLGDRAYSMRVQKTSEPEDISGMYFSKPLVIDSDQPCTITVEENGSMAAATWFDEGYSYAVCTKGACDTAAFEGMVASIWR